jgi:formate dehydrogenase iron-sulfur subunit
MMRAFLVDVTRCRGCEKCVEACVRVRDFDPDIAARDRATTPDGLSANRPTTVVPVAKGRFAPKRCMHCLEPTCASACLVGAITKTTEGPVIYDPDKCIGCRYCMLACPFHIPRYEWTRTTPFMQKCTMCFDRLKDALPPACVEACPNEVLSFGEREGMLARAHQLIDGNPGRYLPRVWGEDEFGGTCVLFVSDVDLSTLGWPKSDAHAIPEFTEPLIAKTPWIGASVFLGAWALSAIIARRNRLKDRGANPNAGEETES